VITIIFYDKQIYIIKNSSHRLIINNNYNMQWRIPRKGSSSTVTILNCNFEVLVFVEGGKPENLRERHELITNSSHL